jgi:hypothetical protein
VLRYREVVGSSPARGEINYIFNKHLKIYIVLQMEELQKDKILLEIK